MVRSTAHAAPAVLPAAALAWVVTMVAPLAKPAAIGGRSLSMLGKLIGT
jgi:hypothetical protein